MNGTVTANELTSRRALLHSLPLSVFVLAFAFAGSMNSVAEPQNSETPLPITHLVTASEQSPAGLNLAMDRMTAEVSGLQHWPAWNYDSLNYRPSGVNFLTQNEVSDQKFLLFPMSLLTSDGDVTWSFFRAGYGNPFSRESILNRRSERHEGDNNNVVYVKFSRAF